MSKLDICGACKRSIVNERTVTEYHNDEIVRIVCYDCDIEERFSDWEKTGRITSWLSTHSYLSKDKRFRPIREACDRIAEAIKSFESAVWFGGAQTQVQACAFKGMSATHGDLKILSWVMCGRRMFTIERGDASVTMLCAEDGHESTMDLRGIDATEEEATDLLRDAREAWAGGLRLGVDRKVGYM